METCRAGHFVLRTVVEAYHWLNATVPIVLRRSVNVVRLPSITSQFGEPALSVAGDVNDRAHEMAALFGTVTSRHDGVPQLPALFVQL